eukprot:Ihof_evm10s100 gene=Ihof_evmTU10s100
MTGTEGYTQNEPITSTESVLEEASRDNSVVVNQTENDIVEEEKVAENIESKIVEDTKEIEPMTEKTVTTEIEHPVEVVSTTTKPITGNENMLNQQGPCMIQQTYPDLSGVEPSAPRIDQDLSLSGVFAVPTGGQQEQVDSKDTPSVEVMKEIRNLSQPQTATENSLVLDGNMNDSFNIGGPVTEHGALPFSATVPGANAFANDVSLTLPGMGLIESMNIKPTDNGEYSGQVEMQQKEPLLVGFLENQPATGEAEQVAALPPGPKRRGRKKKVPLKRVEILKSDEEMKPGLLEEPLIRQGKRARSSTQRLDPTPVKPRVKIIVIPDGIGAPLGEHIHIREQLARVNALDLKETFKVLFDKPGLKATVKQEIKKFKGFHFENEEERLAKVAALEQRSTDHLRFMCEVFNVSKGPDKHAMVRNLMEFLSNPQPQADDNLKKPIAKYNGVRRRPGPRRNSLLAEGMDLLSSDISAGSNSEPDVHRIKHPKNAYIFFMEEMRPRVEAQFAGIHVRDTFAKVGELWKTLGPMERMRYEELARLDKQRYEMQLGAANSGMPFVDDQGHMVMPRQGPAKANRKRNVGQVKRTAADMEEIAPPGDMELRKAVDEIVEEVGDQVTFKQVKLGVEKRYPTINMEACKDRLKMLAQDAVRERSLGALKKQQAMPQHPMMVAPPPSMPPQLQHHMQTQQIPSHLLQQTHHTQ